MDDTCFDLLCKDMAADEAKLFRKMMTEWSDGDENGFPVQLALLTRVQWRAAAKIPLLVSKAREQFTADFVEHRQEIIHLVSGFEEAIASKLKAVETVVTKHDKNTHFTLAEMRSALANAETVGKRIKAELEEGSIAWKQSRADFEAERQMLEKARNDLEAHTNRRDWVWFGLALAGVLAIGVAIGLRIAR
jgi:hypothetical protein